LYLQHLLFYTKKFHKTKQIINYEIAFGLASSSESDYLASSVENNCLEFYSKL